MQDNDFDKIFSHKFDQLPGASYSEENWSELSRCIDAHERRQRHWLLPVLLPFISLLIGGNIFWWHQWREAAGHPKTSEKHITLAQMDTIIRRTIVYRYDTVYQNITLVRMSGTDATTLLALPRPRNSPSENNFSLTNPAFQTNTNPLAPNAAFIESPAVPNVQDSVKQQLTNGDAAAPGHSISHKAPADTSALATPLPSPEIAAADTLFENLLKSQPLPTKKVQSPFLYFSRPRLGVSAMWGNPSLPHKRSGSVWGAGIRADVEIARNFRLGTEIAYQQAGLKADETQALENLDVEIPEPSGDFKLKYWEAYFLPTFTYALHLRYEIPLRGNWTPWIGAGGQAATSLPFEVEYEFENVNNSLELHVPAKTEASTRWQGMLFMVGAECRLNPRLYFDAESYLLRSFSEKPGLLDNQFGLKTSLLYKF